MLNEILKRLKEASFSILPIVFAILLVNFVLYPSTSSLENQFAIETNGSIFGPALTSLLISTIPLIIGTALFSIGAEKSVAKIGEVVGKTLTKKKSLIMLFVIALLMGFLVTIAEPDLSVLSQRIFKGAQSWILILVASLGVGVFLLVAVIRVVFNKPLKYWLAIGYGLVFTLSLFADKDFISVVFDAGGVTTGVVTTPFILALSMGVAQVIGGKNAEDASFGYSGLCTLGTILFVMLFASILKSTNQIQSIKDTLSVKFNIEDFIDGKSDSMLFPLNTFSALPKLYLNNFLGSLLDVTISIAPILIFFFVFNFYAKIKGKEFNSILIGFGYTFIGLVLFFLGAESGFIPVASSLGKELSNNSLMVVSIIVLLIFGFISMLAEPSVKILASNVADVSRGVISKKTIIISLGISTAIAMLINVLRIKFNIDYTFFIVPLIIIAIILAFVSPEIYVGIAIDSAGVATGTMASCFFLPLFISYTASLYKDSSEFGSAIMKNGFGLIGIMAALPIIVVEILGTFTIIKSKLTLHRALSKTLEPDDSQVIHLPVID